MAQPVGTLRGLAAQGGVDSAWQVAIPHTAGSDTEGKKLAFSVKWAPMDTDQLKPSNFTIIH